MKALVGMIVYNRKNTVNWWMKSWSVAEKYADAKLAVVHNYDGLYPNPTERHNINKWKPDHYLARRNEGQDIGALRDLIRDRRFDPWDVLIWFVDDNIPIRTDFIKAFMEPFEKNPNMGLVGNYWVKGSFYPDYKAKVIDHFRTSCFAIRREAAMKLYFPTNIRSKWDCYAFEWLGFDMCLTEQVKRMGFDTQPVIGDWKTAWVDSSKYVWDVGCLHMKSQDPRCRRDHWKQWESQFATKDTDNDRTHQQIQETRCDTGSDRCCEQA